MIETKQLKNDLLSVYSTLGHCPTMVEYSECGEFNSATYERRFGTWNEALLRCIGTVNRQSPAAKTSHPCDLCKTPTTNPRFCSRGCAISFNNKLPRNRMKPQKRFCTTCNKFLEKGRRNPCCQCSLVEKIKKFGEKKISDFSSTYARHRYQSIRNHAHRVAKMHGIDKQCSICGYDKKVELSHKKPIASFSKHTKLSTVNKIENLAYLCPNHHSELDAGILNKGWHSTK